MMDEREITGYKRGRAEAKRWPTRSRPLPYAHFRPRSIVTIPRRRPARRCLRCGIGSTSCRTTASPRSDRTAMPSVAASCLPCRCRVACGPAGA